jgi:hypothetical protein
MMVEEPFNGRDKGFHLEWLALNASNPASVIPCRSRVITEAVMAMMEISQVA